MNERATRWAFWALALTLAAVINAIDFWCAVAVRDWVFGPTGAAWVQAFGSIAAIVAAMVIGARQHRSAMEAVAHQARLQEQSSRRTVVKLAEAALSNLEELSKTVGIDLSFQKESYRYQHGRSQWVTELSSIQHALQTVQLQLLPADLITDFVAITQAVHRARAHVDHQMTTLIQFNADRKVPSHVRSLTEAEFHRQRRSITRTAAVNFHQAVDVVRASCASIRAKAGD